MEIRTIKPAEREEIRKLQMYAFAQWSAQEKTEEQLEYIDEKSVLALIDDKKFCASLVCHPFRQVIRKSIKKMGGIAGVTCYPEYRRKGYVRQLMQASFAKMYAEQHACSLLQPFKESFYEDFDYVTLGREIYWTLPVVGFAHYLKYQAPQMQALRLCPADAQGMFFELLERLGPTHHGTVIYNNLKQEYIDRRWSDHVFIIIKRGNAVCAAMHYLKEDWYKANLKLYDIFWEDEDARCMLFKWIALHLDHIKTVVYPMPYGQNFLKWLKDVPVPINGNMHSSGWMGRIIDVAAALSDIEVNLDAELYICLTDKYCPENEGYWQLIAKDNFLKAQKCPPAKQAVKIDIKGLSALFYGSHTTAELVKNNHLAKETKILDTWFPLNHIHINFEF